MDTDCNRWFNNELRTKRKKLICIKQQFQKIAMLRGQDTRSLEIII